MDTPTQMEAQRITSVRRNGKPQSCEPCRQSKLRCDHLTPICGRCQRRGRPSECIYHPAPLTRKRPLDIVADIVGSEIRKIPRDSLSRTPGAGDRSWSSTFSPPSRSEGLDSVESAEQVAPITIPAFLGPTSYSAVFSENKTDFGPDSISNTYPDFSLGSLPVITFEHIERGAQVLGLLSNMPLFDYLLDRYNRTSQNIATIEFLRDAFRHCVTHVHKDTVKKPNKRQFLSWSETISKNTIRPMQVPHGCTPDQFVAQFTGEKLRWETIGIYFTMVGLGVMTYANSEKLCKELKENLNYEPGVPGPAVKKHLASQMISAAEVCAGYSDHAGTPNDITVWMLFELTILISVVYGDDNYQVWRRMGDLSTAVFALGLHEGIESNEKVPFFLAELRRREFCLAYNSDKLISTFLGRPPRITRHYCKFQLPTYIGDNDIVADDESRNLALSKLDENGWSKDGSFHRVLWTRVWMLGSMIREEILELYLGSAVKDIDVRARVEDIARHSEEIWATIPKYLDYSPSVWTSGTPHNQCFTMLVVHFDRVYSEFLLQRALVKRTGERSKALTAISQKLLTAVLTLGTEQNKIAGHTVDLAWLISFYGLPSAGILAIELLRQLHQPSTPLPGEAPFPRSEIIQKLSVFVSLIETVVKPGDANYFLCESARKALKQTLDRVLSPPPTSLGLTSNPSVNDTQYIPAPGVGHTLLWPQEDGFDFLNWIDTMDFDKGPWMNTTEFGREMHLNI